jgi:hypothetical protein
VVEVVTDTRERVLSGAKDERFSISLAHQTNTGVAGEPGLLGTDLIGR